MLILFGGSFDPFHVGHAALVKFALATYHPDKLLVVPSAQNPLKGDRPTANDRHRLAMTELAMRELGDSCCQVLDWELKRPAPSFTFDTVRQIVADANLSRSAPIVLLMGNDVYFGLPKWHKPQALLTLADFIVVSRSVSGEGQRVASQLVSLGIKDATPTDRNHRIQFLENKRWVDYWEVPMPAVSASMLRASLRKSHDLAQVPGDPPEGLVGSVWEYIKENKLYSVRK